MPNTVYCRTCSHPVLEQAVVCTSCGCAPGAPGKFCPGCRLDVLPQAILCLKCGVALGGGTGQPPSKVLCALLAFLVPCGIHRFLMGYQTEGIIQVVLFFLVCFGWIWSFIDGILILTGSLKMKDGRELV